MFDDHVKSYPWIQRDAKVGKRNLSQWEKGMRNMFYIYRSRLTWNENVRYNSTTVWLFRKLFKIKNKSAENWLGGKCWGRKIFSCLTQKDFKFIKVISSGSLISSNMIKKKKRLRRRCRRWLAMMGCSVGGNPGWCSRIGCEDRRRCLKGARGQQCTASIQREMHVICGIYITSKGADAGNIWNVHSVPGQ